MDDHEEQLVLEMCEEDIELSVEAFKKVLIEHGNYVRASVHNLLRNHGITFNLDEMADEIFQKVATQLWEAAKKGKLLDVDSLKRYFFGAARLRTLNYLRQGSSNGKKEGSFESEPQETNSLLSVKDTDELVAKELEEALFDCIELLPGLQETYVRILAAHHNDPPSFVEIAEMREVSPSSVRNRVHEARKKLMNCMNRKGFDVPGDYKGEAK